MVGEEHRYESRRDAEGAHRHDRDTLTTPSSGFYVRHRPKLRRLPYQRAKNSERRRHCNRSRTFSIAGRQRVYDFLLVFMESVSRGGGVKTFSHNERERDVCKAAQHYVRSLCETAIARRQTERNRFTAPHYHGSRGGGSVGGGSGDEGRTCVHGTRLNESTGRRNEQKKPTT